MNPPPKSDLAKPFDVFLCHNSLDKPAIRAIACQLKNQGISYWLDEEKLPAGTYWLDTQERDMEQIGVAAVFVGRNGIGKYQRLEITVFLQQFVEHQLPIIPVFLPDAPPDTQLSLFLKLFTWVDFRSTDPEPMSALIQGITQPVLNTDLSFIADTRRTIAAEIQINIPNNLTQQGAIAFVGRKTELDRLHDLLQQETPVAIGAIAGMGGVGKTELALQYAYQQRDRQTYPGSICWLQARQDLKVQLVLFAQTHLGLQPPTDLDLNAQLHWCWQRWGKGKTLLVLDDVQAYADVEALAIPGRSQFKILITTRSHFGSSVQELNLEVLSEAAALELLRSLVTDGRIDRQLAEAKAICEWLGYLPLGLELVGRYLARKPDVSLTKLQERLQSKRLEAKALKDQEPGMTASLGVAAAFELSWQELSPEAQQLAAWLSLFALTEIPWHLVQACLPEQDEEELEDLRDEKLVGLSLLKRTEAGHYRLHQLLREFFAAKRQQMAGTKAWHETFFEVIRVEAKRSSERPTRSLLEETTAVIPHMQAAIKQAENNQHSLKVALGKSWLAELYKSQGRHSEAEPFYLQALETHQSQLGHDHPNTASSLNGLARLYQWQGRYSEAETLLLQALKIYQLQLGYDHPDTATSLNNLALSYQSQGRYNEAESLFLQALEIRRSQLGHDHPYTAFSLNNLAELYRSQGRYSEAEPLLLRALEITRSQLGHDHLETASCLNNLAGLYRSQGHYSEAAPLFLQALEIMRSQLGSDHPDTATSLNNLAVLYNSQGYYSEAEPLYLQALEIRRSQLGHNHPSVAQSLNNLAFLYQLQGRYSEAEPLYLQALEITRSQLGHNHPYTAHSLNILAGLYNSQGRYNEAEPLLLQALEITRSQLGQDPLDTAFSLTNLAGLYKSQRRCSEAESLYLQALEITQSQLGRDHSDTAVSLSNLALLYQLQERYGEAEPFYVEALAILFSRLGKNHTHTTIVLNNFYTCLQQALEAGQSDRLSDDPFTQSILQQLRTP